MDNQQFVQGTNGSSMQFIDSSNLGVWTHKNNYYINWWCRNSGGTDINVFRRHNTKIYRIHQTRERTSIDQGSNPYEHGPISVNFSQP
jgi:hypothetical protein